MDISTILNFINQADDTELTQMVNAIMERYKGLHPGWEVMFLSLPLHDPQARRRLLEFALKYEH